MAVAALWRVIGYMEYLFSPPLFVTKCTFQINNNNNKSCVNTNASEIYFVAVLQPSVAFICSLDVLFAFKMFCVSGAVIWLSS